MLKSRAKEINIKNIMHMWNTQQSEAKGKE